MKTTLNAAQKKAVLHAGKPMLIVAGAGTGKTTVITKKICHLIESKQALPEEILALTFTEKAAGEMSSRIDEIISVGYADLQISTFHAFCQRLLEHYGLEIGLPNQFTLFSEASGWVFLRQNLAKFNLQYYKPLGNPARHIHALLRHFSKCKDELISPEEYRQYAEGQKRKQGDMQGLESDPQIELAESYHTYCQLLRERGAFDFADLIYYSVLLLQQRPRVLAELQKRYRYILIDEFQDVNWAQYMLVRLLAGNGDCLTVVGDDDQSIYAFRGASVSNILRFKTDFSGSEEIVLRENYRSTQSILDLAYASIQHNNPDRLEVKLKIDKQLIAHGSGKKGGRSQAVVHWHEAALPGEIQRVADEIERLKKTDPAALWDDFAILVRANSHAEPFMKELESRGLPYEFVASAGLYRQPIVIDLLSYLRAAADSHDSLAIYRLMNLPFLNWAEADIHAITFEGKRRSLSYFETLGAADRCGLTPEGIRAALSLRGLIEQGMRQARTEKPSVLLYNFLESSGYLKYLAAAETKGDRSAIRQVRYLAEFLQYIKEYETLVPEARALSFVDHFSSVLESGDRGALHQPSETPDSINILTVHGAKGLEFKYVFIVNLVEDRFPARYRGEAIEIPEALIKEQLPEGDFHYQEERRLFYVAITRAKERLYLTSASSYGGVRAKKISRFLAELNFSGDSKTAIVPVSAASLSPRRPSAAAEPVATPAYELPSTFSFSQLKSYQVCPYRYKLAHVLRLPTRGNASFSFGQSIHRTLQLFYERVRELNSSTQTSLFESPRAPREDGGVAVPSIAELLAMYEKSWIPDWYESAGQRQTYFKKGKDVLELFYASQQGQWSIPVHLESWFKIKIGGYALHGRIDRIDQLPDKSLAIIDYKTGQAKEKLTAEDKEQLLIYQIAAQELPQFKNLGTPSLLTFYYLENNIKSSFLGGGNELQELRQRLLATIERIQGRDFAATPNQFACAHCDFKNICEFRV